MIFGTSLFFLKKYLTYYRNDSIIMIVDIVEMIISYGKIVRISVRNQIIH